MFLKIYKIIIILFLGFLPMVSGAQILPSETDINVKMRPEFPRANQIVSLEIESFVTNLDKAEINWYKNGILQRSGLGEKGFSIETRDLGTVENIFIEVVTNNIGTINKQIKIRPAEVDLVWETDSFTPPFYKGKALNSYQSDIRIITIPNLVTKDGLKISSENLIYKWRKDWTVLGSKSGTGKNTLLLNGFKILRDAIIIVDVQTLDGSIQAQRSITIKNNEPKTFFYKKDSLLGTMFNKAISNKFNLTEDEISLIAYPFFFSKRDFLQGNLKYSWTMNSKKIDNNDSNLIVLRQEGGVSGSSRLGLEISNINKIMQSVRKRLNIVFGEEGKTIFGQ